MKKADIIDMNDDSLDARFTELVIEDVKMIMQQYELDLEDIKKVIKIMEEEE